ncbi:MAG: hypothetical protein H6601_00910 [Flavobacteriales bacterium]|nr:hypothetical protein [Flavobacteriales bacterium]MCB9185287.1 hypothetical protein [Flavobacteriales bacterium]
MEQYKNIKGTSKVKGYKIEERQITITFLNNEVYQYSYTSAGHEHVETMKLLARAGWGLGAYIEEVAKEGNSKQLA